MDLETYASARGRIAALAQSVRAQPQLMWQWCKRVRPVPDDRCHDIERETKGAVTCEELRPDIRWHRIADANWPWHPDGRPLIDVAHAAPEPQEATP